MKSRPYSIDPNKLRVSRFREARRFVELFPEAYRIRYHNLGRNGELFAWTLEEKVTGHTFQTSLFQVNPNREEVTTTYGYRTEGKTTGWSIIDFCRQAWRRPFNLRSV